MAASFDGSLTLFKNGKSLKSVKLPGDYPLVRFINGEIVTAARYGKLTVLNKELEILKTFRGTEKTVQTLTGNNNHIAVGDYGGAVRYYNRLGGIFPRVSEFSSRLKFIHRSTIMKKESIRWT